jgi:SAM-dependent methyltransferase
MTENTNTYSWSDQPRIDHGEFIADLLSVAGKSALDIGCGNGRITRILAAQGATAIGIDPGDKQLERANAAEKTGDERYIKGGAEALPVDDNSAQIAVYFNSFHHVPMDLLETALSETHRVLEDGGDLFFAEPIAEGPQFELNLPIPDETEIRAKAYDAIKAAGEQGANQGFEMVQESIYVATGSYQDFDEFRINSTSISPDRAKLFAAKDAEMRDRFDSFGDHRADGIYFDQPVRANLLRKI